MPGKVFNLTKGVLSFNGRKGNVISKDGDYTPDQVGAANRDLSNLTDYQRALHNIGGRPNKTHIINGYFIGGGTVGKFPINQRGKTSYGLEPRVMAFDGWAVGLSGKVTLENDGIILTIGESVYGYATLEQIIENKDPLVNTTVTLSAATDEDIYSISGIVSTNAEAMRMNIGAGLDFRAYLYENKLYVQFVVLPGSSVKVRAAKLENGNHQTLGWKDDAGVHLFETSDYGVELARCQRYLLPINREIFTGCSTSGGQAFFEIPIPAQMRAVPALEINGKVYARYEGNDVELSGLSVQSMYGNSVAIIATSTTSLPPKIAIAGYVESGKSMVLNAEL